jgi:EAL domain-containing protein (putative c-di-GMP-specific phosphodiesterase class I)/CheY-like chemotaxis protein
MNATSGLTYVVVEDQGFQRWLIASLLEDLGAKAVYPVSDGGAALEVLERLGESVDVVVSDLDMPGMDGMALIRHVAARHHRASFLIVSAHSQALLATVEAMAREYGVNFVGAIKKPLTREKFEAALASHRQPDDDPQPREVVAYDARQLEAGLRADEFEAFFQPKVDLATHGLRGAEALSRWRRPYREIVLPAAFIETLESSGLIDSLTQRMARAAMAGCRKWTDAGLDASVSINLSAVSLSRTSLADEMKDLASEMRVAPRLVTFEITESAAAREPARKLENLSRLRMSGFGLSIDDFGTGYSSMQRLSRIPFTELKIDQSFVKNVVSDPSCRAMVESSLDLARKLGIVAVAEGVESQGQWETLRALGCPLAQGHYISKAIEAAEFMSWAAAHSRSSDHGGSAAVE